MRLSKIHAMSVALLCCSCIGHAQSSSAYQDTNLPAEQRAADLIHRMTLEDKASQMANQARAIPRLNIPSYDWWSEALHDVNINSLSGVASRVTKLLASMDNLRSTEMNTFQSDS